MSKGVVSDFMAFPVNALGQTAEILSLESDQEECSRHMLSLEDVENLRGPCRIRTVVEGHGKSVFAETIARHTIRLGQTVERFVVDESGLLVNTQIALAVGGPGLDVQDFAAALHVDVLARRDIFQSIGSIGLSRRIPHPPQGAIFRTQPPQGEGLDAEHLGGAHFVQGSHCIEKPDIVAEVIVVAIAEVRVERVAVKINVFFGIARPDPGFLHGNTFVRQSRRQFAFFWPLDPVVSIVADGADELLFRNHLHGGLKVGREPVL